MPCKYAARGAHAADHRIRHRFAARCSVSIEEIEHRDLRVPGVSRVYHVDDVLVDVELGESVFDVADSNALCDAGGNHIPR